MPLLCAPVGYVAGVTMPQYGMPMCGTPIGLPGPPHVPLGVLAGLQSHTMVNHTKVKMPEPTHKMKIDVKEKPGYCYPEPPDHVRIVERTTRAGEPRGPWTARPHARSRPPAPSRPNPESKLFSR